MGGAVGLNVEGMDGHSMARHERLYAWVVQGLRYLDGRADSTIGRVHVTTMEGGTISVCPGILGSWEEMRWVYEVGGRACIKWLIFSVYRSRGRFLCRYGVGYGRVYFDYGPSHFRRGVLPPSSTCRRPLSLLAPTTSPPLASFLPSPEPYHISQT